MEWNESVVFHQGHKHKEKLDVFYGTFLIILIAKKPSSAIRT